MVNLMSLMHTNTKLKTLVSIILFECNFCCSMKTTRLLYHPAHHYENIQWRTVVLPKRGSKAGQDPFPIKTKYA